MSVPERNAAVIRHFFDTVLNRGQATAAQGLLAACYQEHGGFRGAALAVDRLEACLATVRASVGGRYMIEDLIADADKVVVRTRIIDDRSHEGDRPVFWAGGVHIFRLDEERIVEHWALETPPEPGMAVPAADRRIW